MTATADYAAFLESESQANIHSGFEPLWMPDCLLDFQAVANLRAAVAARSTTSAPDLFAALESA